MGLYRLKPEDEYLFYMVHLSKHMSEGGSGLRSILDNRIYFRCFPDMDESYLEKELEGLGLLEFARQVQVLSRCWFETGLAIPEALEPLAQAICSVGTYGTLQMRTHNRMARLRQKHPQSGNALFCLLSSPVLPPSVRDEAAVPGFGESPHSAARILGGTHRVEDVAQ